MSSSPGGFILAFRSIHDALAAEKRLSASGIAVDLVPVPQAVSSDCGFCLFLGTETAGDADTARSLASIEGVRLEALWRITLVDAERGTRKEKRYDRES